MKGYIALVPEGNRLIKENTGDSLGGDSQMLSMGTLLD